MELKASDLIESADAICEAINVLVEEKNMRPEDAEKVVFMALSFKKTDRLYYALSNIEEVLDLMTQVIGSKKNISE